MMCETLRLKSSYSSHTQQSAHHAQICSQKFAAPSAAKQEKKRVRFCAQPPAVRSVLSLDDYSEAEIASCWWNDSECEGARINAQYIAATAKKSPLIRMLEETYMRVQDHVYAREQDELEERTFHPPSHLTQHLEKWSSVAHSVRGLERWVSKKQRSLRGLDARNARDIVLDLYFVVGSTDCEVAQAYAECTRASSMYARLVGFADQEAVLKSVQREPTAIKENIVSLQLQPVMHSTNSEAITIPNENVIIALSKPVQLLRRCSRPSFRTNLVTNVSTKAA